MFFVALSNIRSLYNVGSLFRTADAFNIDRLIIGGYTGYPPHKEITKTALGAENWVPWERAYHLGERLRELKEQRFSIVGLENNIQNTLNLNDFVPTFPLVLVVGNEVKGISRRLRRYIDTYVSIPMYGRKESLNVAVAFGIAVWHIKVKEVRLC